MSGEVVVGLFGPPLSGKGTLAKELSALKIPHISTGEMLRDAIKAGKVDATIAALVQNGRLVPDDTLISLLIDRISKEDCQKGFILDGFPRTISQAIALQAMNVHFTHIVEIEASMHTILQRQEKRASEQGRQDDTASVVRKRVHDYYFQTVPVIKHYETQSGVKCLRINTGQNDPKLNARIVLDEISNAAQKLRSRL